MLFLNTKDYYKLELVSGIFDITNDFKNSELNLIIYDLNYQTIYYRNYGVIIDKRDIKGHNQKLLNFINDDKLFVVKVGWQDGFQFQKNRLYFYKTNKNTYKRSVQYYIDLSDSELNNFKEEFKKLLVNE
jgi:hypothetical protein